MPKKMIYAVSEGSYSDYQVVALFSSKRKANEYAKAIGGGVEDYELDPKIILYYSHIVGMDKEGNVHKAIEPDRATDERYGVPKNRIWFGDISIKVPTYKDNFRIEKVPSMSLTLFYKRPDIKKAIKYANELRGMIIAENLWGKAKEVNDFMNSKKVKA